MRVWAGGLCSGAPALRLEDVGIFHGLRVSVLEGLGFRVHPKILCLERVLQNQNLSSKDPSFKDLPRFRNQDRSRNNRCEYPVIVTYSQDILSPGSLESALTCRTLNVALNQPLTGKSLFF